MRWLNSVTASMNMNLSKLQETVKDRDGWHAAGRGVTKIQTWLRDGTTTCVPAKLLRLCTLWTVARQAFLSLGFSRQEYWRGLLFPSTGDLPNPGIESTSLMSPTLAGRFFTTRTTKQQQQGIICFFKISSSHRYTVEFSRGHTTHDNSTDWMWKQLSSRQPDITAICKNTELSHCLAKVLFSVSENIIIFYF